MFDVTAAFSLKGTLKIIPFEELVVDELSVFLMGL